jgi:hypothetical protein
MREPARQPGAKQRIHIAALGQMRHAGPGRDYYLRKLAACKTKRAALRCLKRRMINVIYRQLVADATRKVESPGGQSGATLSSSAADLNPMVSTSDQPQPRARDERYSEAAVRVLTTERCRYHTARAGLPRDPYVPAIPVRVVAAIPLGSRS